MPSPFARTEARAHQQYLCVTPGCGQKFLARKKPETPRCPECLEAHERQKRIDYRRQQRERARGGLAQPIRP